MWKKSFQSPGCELTIRNSVILFHGWYFITQHEKKNRGVNLLHCVVQQQLNVFNHCSLSTCRTFRHLPTFSRLCLLKWKDSLNKNLPEKNISYNKLENKSTLHNMGKSWWPWSLLRNFCWEGRDTRSKVRMFWVSGWLFRWSSNIMTAKRYKSSGKWWEGIHESHHSVLAFEILKHENTMIMQILHLFV